MVVGNDFDAIDVIFKLDMKKYNKKNQLLIYLNAIPFLFSIVNVKKNLVKELLTFSIDHYPPTAN